MQTQKDHVEAYAFLVGRMSAALVTGDAAFLEVPARRSWFGLVLGVLLTVLVAAGVLLFGLVRGYEQHHAAVAVNLVQPEGR